MAVLGISDYIVFDLATHTAHTLLNPKIQVYYNQSLQQWTVIGEDGTEYYFGEYGNRETTEISGGDDGNGSSSMVYGGISTTSWLLTKVVSKNKIDTYELNYKLYTWAENYDIPFTSRSFKKRLTCGSVYESSITASIGGSYKSSQREPLSVLRNGEYVARFKYKAREDLPLNNNPYMGGNALEAIILYKYKASVNASNFEALLSSDIATQISFNHTYFGNNDSGVQPFYYKRLKLDSFTIFRNAISEGKTYSFDYDRSSQVPSIKSKGQDFLGLYNGAGNADLIPYANFGTNFSLGLIEMAILTRARLELFQKLSIRQKVSRRSSTNRTNYQIIYGSEHIHT